MRSRSICLTTFLCLVLSSCDSSDNDSAKQAIDYNVDLDLAITSIVHVNLNTSNYYQSRDFYETLGFTALLEVEENVDAEHAAALAMPPYDFHASPMFNNGSLIDLMQWVEPFDDTPPYQSLNHLGISSIALVTTDLDADIDLLESSGATLLAQPTNIERYNNNIRFAFLKDTDGVALELFEVIDEEAVSSGQPGSYITHIQHITINCSDFERSLSFYKMLGFSIVSEATESESVDLETAYNLDDYDTQSALLKLDEGMGIKLVKWNAPYDNSPPYEKPNHLGLARIALESIDIDEDTRKLTELGLEFYSEPVRTSGAFSTFRIVFFEDPDGNVLELVEY